MDELKILFKLRDMADIIPWGEPPDLRLHWFGLSDGAYCLETKAGRLLAYKGATDDQLGVPWCAYQVVRLFEDLIQVLPHVLEPVPEDVAARHFAWLANAGADIPDDDELAEAWFEAQAWWGSRQLDFGYLTASPLLHFWRVGSNVHLRWRTRGHAAALELAVQSADAVMPVAAFETCVDAFFRDFLGAMRERVAVIANEGWRGQDCAVDVCELVAEQTMRESEPLNLGRSNTDWDTVRRRLSQLGF